MTPFRLWLLAARPRTLPAAVAPVLVGTALALTDDVFRPLAFVAALVGSVFIQIGTNLSNDYSDARRGADTEDRLGPVRVTAGGLLPPRRVLVGTYLAFGIAVAAGAYLAAVAGWELLVVGVLSILAGVLYTGGPRPYGYEGLGELFVFLFFGVVAVVGSYYVQTEELVWEAFALSVPVGLLAAAILVVNNVRDVDTDRRAGKRTLAVKLGRERARGLFVAMLVARVRRSARGRRGGGPVLVARADRACLAAGRAAGAHRSHAHGRPGAERGAGRHRPPAGGLLDCCCPPASCCREALAAAALDPVPRPVRDVRRGGDGARAGGAAAGGRRRRDGLRRGRPVRALRRRAARAGGGRAERRRGPAAAAGPRRRGDRAPGPGGARGAAPAGRARARTPSR